MISKLKKLRQHHGFMRYFENISWLMSEKFLRMFIGLFVGIWVARYLGPEQFGLLSYAQSFVFLFIAISTLGLDSIVVRELVKDESKRDVLLGTAFGLKLVGAILILPILAMAVQLTSNDDYTNSLIFITASLTIFQSFNVIDFYYQSKVLSKYVALANAISLAISSIIKIALILGNAPLVAFALITVFDVAVVSVGLIYFYKKNSQLKLFNWRFEWKMAKKLLQYSWPLILSGLVISLYMRIDQVMIKEILDADAVGQYAAAVRLSTAWYFIPLAIATSFFPAIINAKKISEELYFSRLQRLYSLMIFLAIAIALPVTFLSDWVILLLYGSEYSQAGEVLMIHIWAGIFVFLGVAWSKWILNENKQNLVLISHILGAVINVGLNLYFIDKYGVVGAAYSTIISYFLSQIIGFSLYKAKLTYALIFWTKDIFGNKKMDE